MGKIFNVEDRQNALDYIFSSADECSKIVSLVQVGSGAEGFHDEKSDLDLWWHIIPMIHRPMLWNI